MITEAAADKRAFPHSCFSGRVQLVQETQEAGQETGKGLPVWGGHGGENQPLLLEGMKPCSSAWTFLERLKFL